jgi:hypothetical protein
MKQLLKNKTILLIFLTFMSYNNSFGQESDSLKCNISIVREAYQNIENISDELMLKFLETFGKDCKNNVEFSEFSNETLFKVIQKNPEVFSEILEKNLNQIDFEEIIFNLRNPLHDLIDLDLTINKIADTKIDKSVRDKLIIAINSGNWEESKNVEKVNGKTVMFFLPDSAQFNAIANSDKSEGINEVSSDFQFYAGEIIDLYKDSTLNVTYSKKRYFIVNNQVIDKMKQESPFGILLVNNDKFKIETGVFSDVDIKDLIFEFYKK